MKCLGERVRDGLAVVAAGEDGGALGSSLRAIECDLGGRRR